MDAGAKLNLSDGDAPTGCNWTTTKNFRDGQRPATKSRRCLDPIGKILDERVRHQTDEDSVKFPRRIGASASIFSESRPNSTWRTRRACASNPATATIFARRQGSTLNSNLLIAQTMIEAGKKSVREFSRTRDSKSCPHPTRRIFPFCFPLTQYVDLCICHAIAEKV